MRWIFAFSIVTAVAVWTPDEVAELGSWAEAGAFAPGDIAVPGVEFAFPQEERQFSMIATSH